jgi:23S rRNA pseudouridine2605 synthase
VLQRLQEGVMLDDGLAAFASILDAGGAGANHWYHVILREGKNREVRRLWESQGLQVSRLIRIRYGPVELPRDVRAGRFRDLTRAEITSLYALVKLDAPKPDPVSRTPVKHGWRRR